MSENNFILDKSDTKIPTLYEYYTSDGIKSGLSDEQPFFTLNGKRITLYSGSLHYFRVPQDNWQNLLRKYRAAGLNAIDTYVPWNLHEPEKGNFCFGEDKSDYRKLLDIKKFIELAKEEDLFVIMRPGPYICAEWEFGGMPSWLLRDKKLKIRTSDKTFIRHFQEYFKVLLKILSPLQFTNGGSIIAFQIENEYGNTGLNDQRYLEAIKETLLSNGIVELLLTSDTPSSGFTGTLPGVLATANFDANMDIHTEISLLKQHQPGKPVMVMEYWSGWFDHWTEDHHVRSPQKVCDAYEELLKMKASVNIYMFHGGSNWGFLNGGNFSDDEVDNGGYMPTISSYDYDAPIPENGDYTKKYNKIKDIIKKYNDVITKLPTMPEIMSRIAFPTIQISGQLKLEKILTSIASVKNKNVLSMEELPINNENGQSYGYIVYKKVGLNISSNSTLTIEGRVCDTVLVTINGKLKTKILQQKEDMNGFGYWKAKDSTLSLGEESYDNATLELVVENWGRANYGKLPQFNQKKGIWQGNVLLNKSVLEDWTVFPLEFKSKWLRSLKDWNKPIFEEGPTLYKAVLKVDDLKDTYIDMRDWKKGIVIINGFVLSRYLHLGPQQSIYIPAPFLNLGNNDLLIFEHFQPSRTVKFCTDPIFDTKK